MACAVSDTVALLSYYILAVSGSPLVCNRETLLHRSSYFHIWLVRSAFCCVSMTWLISSAAESLQGQIHCCYCCYLFGSSMTIFTVCCSLHRLAL